jgi:hypothetical protein
VEARLAAGAVAERRNVDVAHLLQDLVAGLPVKEGKTIATEVEAGLELMADESLLYSALSNLLQNALKYSHPHEPILVRARREDDAVYFEIEDRCGGLPPGKAEELFAPFQQLPGTASGSGLGLTIARRAIEAHGGRIWVTNLPGVGCVFTAELPREVHAVVSAPALHRVPSR